MHGALTPLPNMPLSCVQRQLYLYMEAKVSLLCSNESTTGPYIDSVNPTNYFLGIHLGMKIQCKNLHLYLR
jgi:hypothetical protein